jgi:hypothetical protein
LAGHLIVGLKFQIFNLQCPPDALMKRHRTKRPETLQPDPSRSGGIRDPAVPVSAAPSSAALSPLHLLFAALFGAFFGLCLLKFGNPPVMEKFMEAPKSSFELLAMPWPIHWASWMLGFISVLGLILLLRSRPPGISLFGFLSSFACLTEASERRQVIHSSFSIRTLTLLLPLGWLLWQVLSACFSISHELSTPTVIHYTACVLCFYLGVFCLSRLNAPTLSPSHAPTRLFWLGIFCGFVFLIAIGLDQHFGGLEDGRNFFNRQRELYPGKEFPPEFLKKMASNRIYSTLFYPNTLAGALLLFSPIMLLTTMRLADRWRLGNVSQVEVILVLVGICVACLVLYLFNTRAGWLFILLLGLSLIFPVPRWIAPSLLALGILAVLFWSGSKAGWLLMLSLGLIALLRFPLPSGAMPVSEPSDGSGAGVPRKTQHATRVTHHARRIKLLIIVLLLLAGLTGFFLRYSTFFKKGATSVSARFDYWRATLEITKSHPVLGTGPGTFQIPYEKIKRPESEMARLAHNDYLQQASDSGLPGFLLYTFFIISTLLATRPSPSAPRPGSDSSFRFATWLGLLGWAAQCLVEFSLQIPALAWPAFALLGCLVTVSPQRSDPSHPP